MGTRPSLVSLSLVSLNGVPQGGIASDADYRQHRQNNRNQDEGNTKIVSDRPLRDYPIIVRRGLRQRSDKQYVIPGVVKSECDHVS